MESLGLSIGSLSLIILVVWYLGSSINAIISKAGVMAEDEFTQFRRAQKYRIKKDNETLKAKTKSLHTNQIMTDDELDALLGLTN